MHEVICLEERSFDRRVIMSACIIVPWPFAHVEGEDHACLRLVHPIGTGRIYAVRLTT